MAASFELGLAQTGYPQDGDVARQAEMLAHIAARQGVQLLVFPENFMCPRPLSADELREISEPLDGPFVRTMADMARRHHLWIVFTMYEANPRGNAPYNTAMAIDDTGTLRGSYRKCHLYDAHHVRESDRMSAGDTLAAPLVAPFATFGLAICYDLRFPEVARHLATQGCELLLYPACWHDGPHKVTHWKTLLTARAIENECFVAGICHAGEGLVDESLVAGPLGERLALRACQPDDASGTDTLLVVTIDRTDIRTAREAMPIMAHRRPELYERMSSSC